MTERRLRNLLGAPPGECGAGRHAGTCWARSAASSWLLGRFSTCRLLPPSLPSPGDTCSFSPRRAHRGRACLTARPTAGCRDKGSPAPGHRGRAGPPAPGPGPSRRRAEGANVARVGRREAARRPLSWGRPGLDAQLRPADREGDALH